ncbi:hypothetical protein K438DRAFT_1769141 [Mycena galopus ATCC 62051]|nr:hypothetical protein K438DRAFT_1769141 [Mycena galopus ATCC 62051]
MPDSKSSTPACKKNGKQKYCHFKPACSKLLSEREFGDKSNSEDNSQYQMKVNPSSHETFDFTNIPDLGLNQDDSAAMDVEPQFLRVPVMRSNEKDIRPFVFPASKIINSWVDAAQNPVKQLIGRQEGGGGFVRIMTEAEINDLCPKQDIQG